jgi:hypothetical protein
MALPSPCRSRLWALFYGVTDVMCGDLPLDIRDVENPLDEFMSGLQRLFDGYGWRPLTDEHDYDETRRQVRTVLFPHESQH